MKKKEKLKYCLRSVFQKKQNQLLRQPNVGNTLNSQMAKDISKSVLIDVDIYVQCTPSIYQQQIKNEPKNNRKINTSPSTWILCVLQSIINDPFRGREYVSEKSAHMCNGERTSERVRMSEKDWVLYGISSLYGHDVVNIENFSCWIQICVYELFHVNIDFIAVIIMNCLLTEDFQFYFGKSLLKLSTWISFMLCGNCLHCYSPHQFQFILMGYPNL